MQINASLQNSLDKTCNYVITILRSMYSTTKHYTYRFYPKPFHFANVYLLKAGTPLHKNLRHLSHYS